MEKPLALKVISIIILVLSGIRLVAGLFGGIAYLAIPEELGINLLYVIIVENFICGVLMLISGILLLKGKKQGKILFIIATVLAPLAYLIFLHEMNYSWILGLILILLLYLYPSIKDYFKNIKNLNNIS